MRAALPGGPGNPTSMKRTARAGRFATHAAGIGLASLFALAPATAADLALGLRLSVGTSWQARNDVQIPNTDAGTRFSLADAAGEGPVPFARLEIDWALDERHGIRVLLAPLSYTETVAFDDPVRFAGESFAAGRPTEATYRFNSWRVGYHYTLDAEREEQLPDRCHPEGAGCRDSAVGG